MINILVIIPWALTVGALSFIIVRGSRHNDENNYEDLEVEEEVQMERQIIHAAVYESKAFWVHDNVFYESDVTREPDWSTAKPIDTTKLSERSLNNLFKILDDLKNSEKEER